MSNEKEKVIFISKKVSEIVTERIIRKLEQGVVPWRKRWHGTSDIPCNYVTRRPYRGINLILLDNGGEYLTFNQIDQLGGKVKKGAHGYLVVFWKPIEEEEKKQPEEENSTETETTDIAESETNITESTDNATEKRTKTKYVVLRYYTVFHIDDIEGIIPHEKLEPTEPRFDLARKIAKIYGEHVCEFKRGNNSVPFYDPVEDRIFVPRYEKFEKPEYYFGTLFHEMVHSTAHQTRLNRLKAKKWGDEKYSEEELVAEIGSCMLLNLCNIDTDNAYEDSASYIQEWLRVLKNDRTMILRAASAAQKAVEYILKKVALVLGEEIKPQLDAIASNE